MKKRFMSVFLALALCLTLLPTAAWAADAPTSDYTTSTDSSGATIYRFTQLNPGNYNQIGDKASNEWKWYINNDIIIDLSNATINTTDGNATLSLWPAADNLKITIIGKSTENLNLDVTFYSTDGNYSTTLVLDNAILGNTLHWNREGNLNVVYSGSSGFNLLSFRNNSQVHIKPSENDQNAHLDFGYSTYSSSNPSDRGLILEGNITMTGYGISATNSLTIQNANINFTAESGKRSLGGKTIKIEDSTISNVGAIASGDGENTSISISDSIVNFKSNSSQSAFLGNTKDIKISDNSKITGVSASSRPTIGGEFETLTIEDSTVEAAAEDDDAAIGPGYFDFIETGHTITITDSTVTASSELGAAIGAPAYQYDNEKTAPKIEINIQGSSTVTAVSDYGAGIGAGACSTRGTYSANTDINISDTSDITAISTHGNGIGSGAYYSGQPQTGVAAGITTGPSDTWDEVADEGAEAEMGGASSVSLYSAPISRANDAGDFVENTGTLTISDSATVNAESGNKAIGLPVNASTPMMEYTLADDDDVPSVTTPINRTDTTATESYDLRPGFRSLAFWPVDAGTYTLSYGSGADPDPLLDVNNEYASTYTLTAPSAENSALAAFEVVRQQKLSGSVGLKDNSTNTAISGTASTGTNIAVDVAGITPNVGDGLSLTYQWYKDGTVIDSATSASYTPTAPGVYFCAVTGTGLYRGTLNSQAVTVTERGSAAPTAPTMAGNTADSITLNVPSDGGSYQYGLVTADAIKWQNTPEFTGLARNTEYSFVQRNGEDGPVSAAASFSTLPGKPSTDDLQIDYKEETFTVTSGVTAYTDDDCMQSIGENNPNSSITDYIGKTVYLKYDDVTISGNADEVVTAVEIPDRPAAPELSANNISASDTSLSLTGTAGVVYAIFSADDTVNPTETIVGTGNTITFDGLSSETTYFIKARKGATDAAFHSYQARVEVTTSAPLARIGITPVKTEYPYTGEPQSFEFKTVPAGIDGFTVKYYQLTEDGTDFTEETENAPINVGNYKVHITRAADSNYAAVDMTFDMTITAGTQTAPNAPEAEAVTATSVTLKAPESSEGKAVEYAYVQGSGESITAPTDESAWSNSREFTDLQPSTAYTFFARYAAGGNYDVSPASVGTTIYTLPNTPAAGAGYTIDYANETATASATYEISTNGTEWSTETIDIAPGSTLYVRVKSNGDVPASESQTNTLSARPAAPDNITGGNRQISGLTAEMEYSKDGTTWTKVDADDLNEGVLSNLDAGTYQVRYAAVTGESKFASESVEVQVTQPSSSGPTTYPPTIEDTVHGDVSVSPSRPYRGQTVTITPDPDEGYEVGAVTVTDRNGNEVEVTDNGDGTYKFTQPGGQVTIAVTFVRIGADMPFTDVKPGDWFYEYVAYVYANGLMDGTSATMFEPNANMTRAMLVTILWRVEGEPVVNYLLPFTDVPADSWYTEAVRWAASEGIVTGVSETSFAPNAEITREQLAAILHRYAGQPATAANLAGYADAASVSAYAVNAMSWCVEHGIITGVADDTLAPQGTATRAQCAAMLMRFVER